MSDEELQESTQEAYNSLLSLSVTGLFGQSGTVTLYPHPPVPHDKLLLVQYKHNDQKVYFCIARLCHTPPPGTGQDAWSLVWIQPALTPGDYFSIQGEAFKIIYRLDSDAAVKAALKIVENISNIEKIKETAQAEIRSKPLNQIKAYFMLQHRKFIGSHMGYIPGEQENTGDGDTYNANSGLSQLALVAANASMSAEGNALPAPQPENNGQIELFRKRRTRNTQQKRRKPTVQKPTVQKPTVQKPTTVQDLLSLANLDIYTTAFLSLIHI